MGPSRSIPSPAARACHAGRVTSQPAEMLLAYDPGLRWDATSTR